VQPVDQHEGDQHDDEQGAGLQRTDHPELAFRGFLQGAHEHVQLADEFRGLATVIVQPRRLGIEQRAHALLPVLQHAAMQARQRRVAMAVQGRAQRRRAQRALQNVDALLEQRLRTMLGGEGQAVGLHAQAAGLVDGFGITFQGVGQVQAGQHADQGKTDDHHERHQRVEHDRVARGELVSFGLGHGRLVGRR